MNRASLIKECFYYTLGGFLIFGFVYLYWGHFSDAPGPPAAIRYIMGHWGMRAAIIINAAIFLFIPKMLRLLVLDLDIQRQLAMKQYLRRFPIQAHRKDAQP